MAVTNKIVAQLFDETADLLEIEGANPFRVRAYRNSARFLGDLAPSVADMVRRGEDLEELPGIGRDLAEKIQEIVRTGTLAQLEEIRERTSPELRTLMHVAGLGPKRLKTLHDELGVRTATDVREAAASGKIQRLKGFGVKLEQKILQEIERLKSRERRIKLVEAQDLASALTTHIEQVSGVQRVQVAGSYRRRKETVGDLDILVIAAHSADVMNRFVGYEDVAEVVSHGETRSTVVLRCGLQVDVRTVPEESYGAALHYFTGSKAHNIAVRKLGRKNNLKINEYGVFQGERRIGGTTEEDVYGRVGLPFIEPELREDAGEIEAAQEGRLPELIRLEDLRGDLHIHTRETDGRHTLEEMAEAAQRLGYAYMAVTEHSRRVAVARGLDARRLAAFLERIDGLNAKLKGFTILKAIEVDILEDGSLDLPDDILRELDLTVCAVHYHFNLSREKQTERIVRAMDNPYFRILAHPTGRLINERDPYDVDMKFLLEAAGKRGCFMELNSHPDRLDLTDTHCRLAKQMGVKVAVSTDAHSITDLEFMRFGVFQARRGWLEPGDVINTRCLAELRNLLKRP